MVAPREIPHPVALLTVASAAEILGVSERSLRSLISEGALTVVRVGTRAIRVHPADLERFIEERRGRLGS